MNPHGISPTASLALRVCHSATSRFFHWLHIRLPVTIRTSSISLTEPMKWSCKQPFQPTFFEFFFAISTFELCHTKLLIFLVVLREGLEPPTYGFSGHCVYQFHHLSIWCARLDSNQRSLSAADLQSAVIAAIQLTHI